MEVLDILLPLIVFLTIVTMALVVLRRRDQRTQQDLVLSRMSRPAMEEDFTDLDITRDARVRESKFFDTLLARVRIIQRLEQNLWQAGLYVKVTDVIVLMVVLGLAGGAGVVVWSGGVVGFPALMAALGLAVLPLIYIAWRKRRRLLSFDQQLPELLDMIKSSLEAGHTLQRALQVSVQEFSDPASSEFRIVLEQNRLGVPLARALEYMLERIPDENLRFLVVAVKIQTDVGSSLAGIISQLAKTVRDRQRMEMKIRVLTAQPRISALVGGLMPILLLLALSVLNPDAVKMLFHDPAGIKLTKVAAALEVMAFLTISRMVRMDY